VHPEVGGGTCRAPGATRAVALLLKCGPTRLERERADDRAEGGMAWGWLPAMGVPG
jgi:hypothetical protein